MLTTLPRICIHAVCQLTPLHSRRTADTCVGNGERGWYIMLSSIHRGHAVLVMFSSSCCGHAASCSQHVFSHVVHRVLSSPLSWPRDAVVTRQMMRPQIQNDLASYRRHLSRMKKEQEQGLLPQLPVADTDANRISMFIAEVWMV